MNSLSVTTTLGITNATAYSTIPAVTTLSIVFAVCQVVLAILITFGNSLTVAAYAKTPSLRSPDMMLIVALAAADLEVAFSLVYITVLTVETQLRANLSACLFRHFLAIHSVDNSVVLLILLTTDRFIRIVRPLTYEQIVTSARTRLAIILGLVLSLTVSCINVIFHNYQAGDCDILLDLPEWFIPVQLFFFLVFLVFLIVVYVTIFIIARKSLKQLNKSQGISRSLGRTTVTVSIILGVFAICFLPNFAVTSLQAFGVLAIDTPLMEYTRLGAFILATANSGMNPLIYCWKQHSIRRAYLRVLGCRVALPAASTASYSGYATSRRGLDGCTVENTSTRRPNAVAPVDAAIEHTLT